MVLILLGGARQWWYYGHVYRAKVKECDDWKGIALGSLNTIEGVLSTLEPVIEKLGGD